MQHIFLAHLSNTHEKIHEYVSLFALTLHIFVRKVEVIISSLDELHNGQIACR